MFSAKRLAILALILLGGGVLLLSQNLFARNVFFALTHEKTLDRYSQTDTTPAADLTGTDTSGQNATLISAFFGLDDGAPPLAGWVVCEGAAGNDGMPVIFSHEVDVSTLDPGDFTVTNAAGSVGEVVCLTLAPADDPGELRTVLLMGQFGDLEDQPVSVEITGNIHSLDGTATFKGAQVAVTPLQDGPSLILAEIVPQAEWALDTEATGLRFGGGTGCPAGTEQVVRAVWNGGITKPGGAEVDDVERQLYTVTVERSDQTVEDIAPFALGDLYDGDNNHELCLQTRATVRSVSFPAGHVTDPREDLNPATTIPLAQR